MRATSLQPIPAPFASLGRAVLTVLACVAFAAPAEAQILKRLKEKAQAEAVKKADELLRGAVRCVASDTKCVDRAKAAGKQVVLTDSSGAVLRDARGQPITDPRQLPSATAGATQAAGGSSLPSQNASKVALSSGPSTYRPSYPFGLFHLLNRTDSVAPAKRKEVRHVYQQARIHHADFYDAGCIGQAYLTARRDAPVDSAAIASNNLMTIGLPLHGCFDRAKVIARVGSKQEPPGTITEYRTATEQQRDRYHACYGETASDLVIQLSVSRNVNGSAVQHEAGARYMDIVNHCRGQLR